MSGVAEQKFRAAVADRDGAAAAFSRADGLRPARMDWGPWSPGAHGLLIVLTIAAGMVLTVRAPWQRSAPPSHPRTLVLDLNTVPVEVLSALPGVGPALANEIDARRREAPYQSLADLARRTRGVGPATVARLARHLRLPDDLARLPNTSVASF